jgi:16S rRNA (guanine966-N2)-methyltransferase
LRIISGKFKGKNISAPRNLPVRPTTDFAKESLFNILTNSIHFEDIKLLELFAGTGNIGCEFASRGCDDITAVDLNFGCVQFIRKTYKELNIKGKVYRNETFRFLKSHKDKYNMVFADPPYDLENIIDLPDLIFKKKILSDQGVLIIEHDKKIDFSQTQYFDNVRQYGKVNFSFFKFEE